MRPVATLLENYEEYTREIGVWQLQIIAYQLGHKYVCIINNLDPGATICRVSAPTRCEALKRALEEANARLSQVEISDILPAQEPPKEQTLSRLEYQTADRSESYSVAEFLALPVGTRMELILSGSLLYRDAGNGLIRSETAMRLLGQANTAAAA